MPRAKKAPNPELIKTPAMRLGEIRYIVFREWGKTEFNAHFARKRGESVDEAKVKRELDSLNALLARIAETQRYGDDEERLELIEELTGERL